MKTAAASDVRRLVLILGDQLTPSISSLEGAGGDDLVLLAEVGAEATQTPSWDTRTSSIDLVSGSVS